MLKTCTFCSHPDRPAGETALLDGASQRQVAKALGLDRGVVQRHVSNGHLVELLAHATVDVEQVMANEIAGATINLAERALALLTRAEADDDRTTQVQAIREVKGILALLATVRVEQGKEKAMIESLQVREDDVLDAEIKAWIGRTQGVSFDPSSSADTYNSEEGIRAIEGPKPDGIDLKEGVGRAP
jgi:hypothetical protein